MDDWQVIDSTAAYEQALADASEVRNVLRLYVTGATPQSLRAIASVRQVCEEALQGLYELEVIDLYQQPHLAKDDQIIAVPTLIRVLPPPLRRIIGDMSRAGRVLIGLNLKRTS